MLSPVKIASSSEGSTSGNQEAAQEFETPSDEQVDSFLIACSNEVTQQLSITTLTNSISQKRAELKTEQARFMHDTQALVAAQNLAEELATEASGLLHAAEALSAKLAVAKLEMNRVEERRAVVDGEIDIQCQKIDTGNRLIQSMRASIQALERECVAYPVGTIGLAVNMIQVKQENVQCNGRPEVTELASVQNQLKREENKVTELAIESPLVEVPVFEVSDESKFVRVRENSLRTPTCYFFNNGTCSSKQCPNSHECAQCSSSEHGYLQCFKKPHICFRFNKEMCFRVDCFRQHVCVLCHEEGHSLVDCNFVDTLDKDAPQRNLSQFCMYFNTSGECKSEDCARSHHCMHCLGKHASLNCPHAIHKIITSNRTRVLLKKDFFKGSNEKNGTASITGPLDGNTESCGYHGRSENYISNYDRVSKLRDEHFAKAPQVNQNHNTKEMSRMEFLDYQNFKKREEYENQKLLKNASMGDGSTSGDYQTGKRSREHSLETGETRSHEHSPVRSEKRPRELEREKSFLCHYWNTFKGCHFGKKCKFDHYCSVCGGDHAERNCKKVCKE